jgi:hypothetical protein
MKKVVFFIMKKTVIIIVPLLVSFLLNAQPTFKTVVPLLPVTEGESFQVQYIIEDAEKMTNFKPPVFINFDFVAGPNIYTGSVQTLSGVKQIANSVYTLVAVKPGHFFIPGATATINGKLIRSNDAVVEVISKEEAARRFDKETAAINTDYFLRPGEDAYEKIRKNLFLKMKVDKKTCFVGEPVLATFKLYSRLESRSDIVKNPGFYGFAVHDMINLADKQVTTENVHGKLFDVHTIRKVQLYPFRAGAFTIDAMEVKNTVEFSRSAVNKKTEQEITEGVLGNTNKEPPDDNTSIFETDISTDPLTINIKPVPAKNKPANYNGATGIFKISASVVKDKLAKNEEGILEITISGKGNFIQLNAPSIQWPANIEGFEPVVKDMLDKTQSPLSGSRIFRYSFLSANPGLYIIQPVSFSFFNPDSGHYKIITTEALQVNISIEEKINRPVSKETITKTEGMSEKYWLMGMAVLVVCFLGFLWLFRAKKRNTEQIPANPTASVAALSVNEILAPAYLLAHADDKSFYTSLYQAIWKFFTHSFHLSGSEMNKKNLSVKLKENKIGPALIEETQHILQQCETGMFTNADLMRDKNNLLQKTKETLEEIGKSLL